MITSWVHWFFGAMLTEAAYQQVEIGTPLCMSYLRVMPLHVSLDLFETVHGFVNNAPHHWTADGKLVTENL